VPDQTLIKLAAAAPLAVSGLLVLLSPIYDRFIESGAEREFGGSLYLGAGQTHTPVGLITRYASWAVDIVQAATLVFVPLIGIIAALNGNTKGIVGWIDFAFVLVGFITFACIAGVKHPAEYGGRKHGFGRGKKLFGWTWVSIVGIVLYLGASAVVFHLA
jgi:hypothetical protein